MRRKLKSKFDDDLAAALREHEKDMNALRETMAEELKKKEVVIEETEEEVVRQRKTVTVKEIKIEELQK